MSTARDLMLPQSMLLRALGRSIPVDLNPWIQVRPYGAAALTQHLLWIEDRVAAAGAERLWNDENEYDRASHFERQLTQTVRLLSAAKPQASLDRVLARQLLASVPGEMRRAIGEALAPHLLEMVSHEGRAEFAYSWLPLLASAGIDAQPIVRRHLRTDPGLPRDPVSLLLTLHHLGAEKTAEHLASTLDLSEAWTTDDWVDFIALLEHLSPSNSDQLVRIALPLLRGLGPGVMQILSAANSVQLLAPVVERAGGPADRRWILPFLQEIASTKPHAVGQYLLLTRRCLSQPRNELALDIMQRVLLGKGFETREAAERYSGLVRRELEEDLAGRAVDTVDHLTDGLQTKPSIANNVWGAYIRFAWSWAPGAAGAITLRALDLVASTGPQTSVKLMIVMHQSALRAAARLGVLRAPDLRVALDTSSWPMKRDSAAARFIDCLSASAASSSLEVSLAARRALSALVQEGGRSLRLVLMEFVEAARAWTGFTGRLDLPGALFSVDESHAVPATAATLLSNLRWAEIEDTRRAAEAIYRRWGDDPRLTQRVVVAMLRLDAPDLGALRLSRIPAPTPTQWCLWAAVHARQGSLSDAREDLRQVLKTYRQKGRGGHPHTVHQAASEMAAKSRGQERHAYLLVRSLVVLGPLDADPWSQPGPEEMDEEDDEA